MERLVERRSIESHGWCLWKIYGMVEVGERERKGWASAHRFSDKDMTCILSILSREISEVETFPSPRIPPALFPLLLLFLSCNPLLQVFKHPSTSIQSYLGDLLINPSLLHQTTTKQKTFKMGGTRAEKEEYFVKLKSYIETYRE